MLEETAPAYSLFDSLVVESKSRPAVNKVCHRTFQCAVAYDVKGMFAVIRGDYGPVSAFPRCRPFPDS